MLRLSFFFFIIYCSNSFSQELKSELDKLLSSKFFQSTIISVDVYDLTEKKPLYKRNNKLLLTPASNMKILSSAAALYFLEPQYQFTTTVAYNGFVLNGKLDGDLFVTGGFDPLLSTSDIEKLSDQIISFGIKEINGNIIADVSRKDSLYWGSGWMWDDDPSADAPYLSALNVNFNTVSVRVTPGQVGDKPVVSLSPQTAFFNIINDAVTISGSQSDLIVTRNYLNKNNDIILTGSMGRNTSVSKSFNVVDPELYFVTMLKESLESKGIIIKGDAIRSSSSNDLRHITQLRTPLDSVLSRVNKNSNNLCAEMIIYALSDQHFEQPASAYNGLKMIDSLLIIMNFNPDDFSFNDGSGISRYNLVTTELLLETLKFLYQKHHTLFIRLYDSLAIAGYDGTLRGRLKNAPLQNNVRAKTGKLRGVSSLSGYLTNSSGSLIAFSIMIQNYVNKTQQGRTILDEICKLLAK